MSDYLRDPNRPPTVKLSRDEWVNLVTTAVTEIGEEPIREAVRLALGPERANKLIEDKEGPRLSKRDNHAIIRAVYPLIPGDTRQAKIDWLIDKAAPCFIDEYRFFEVVSYVRHRVEEFENAGGSIDHYPEPPPELEGPVAVPAQDATHKLMAAMVTPMFVYSDTGLVRLQAAALRQAGYNSVCSLVDLQTGPGQRDYIIKGRMATKLSDECMANIDEVIKAGLTPIIIIRNDWAVRSRAGRVPSVGGQPDAKSDFYSATRLRYEKQFLDSLAGYYDRIHIQLSIEPDLAESAGFALSLAEHLRASGFRNRLFINPYSAAVAAHEAIRGELAAVGVEWARSHHGSMLPPDPVWNTDGDTALNGSNVRARVAKMQASGKDWILWTQSLANSHGDFPAEYMDVGLSEQTLPAMITGHEKGFLWKPIGENSKKLRVLLPPQYTGKVDLKAVELWHGAAKIETLNAIGPGNPTAEGPREHFAGNNPGGAYNAGTQVRANAEGTVWAWTVSKTGSRNENLIAAKISEAGENR